MQYLFIEFPEIIRDYLEGDDFYLYSNGGKPLSLLNFDLLQKGWPNKDIYNHHNSYLDCQNYLFESEIPLNLPYTLDKAILTLLSIKVEKEEDGFMIKFGNGDFIYLNVYFEKFFEIVFNQKLFYDKDNRVAYSHFRGEIPFNLSSNDDVAAYIACIMHLYLYKYFNLEDSRKFYMVNIPQNIKEYSDYFLSLGIIKKIEFEEDFYDIYRFMYCCKIEHKQHGYYHVGKDDYESKNKTYEFRPRKGHKMSESFINKIDAVSYTHLTLPTNSRV